MPPPQAAPRAVLFDAYGTLFDVYSVTALAQSLFPGHGERLALLWRDKQIEYTRLVSMAGERRTFRDLTRAGLRFAARRLAIDLSNEAEDRLMAEYQRLALFPENRGVLDALKARGVRAGILSNGDVDMLAELVANTGLAALLDPVISVQPTGRFKTDPATYALGPAALDLPTGDILFVSSNGWDAIGATWHGYITLWVNRAGLPLDPLGTAPTRVGNNLENVLDFFPTRP